MVDRFVMCLRRDTLPALTLGFSILKVKIFEYNAVFQEEKDGGFSVWAPALPGCCSQGETFKETVNNIKEAIELYAA